MNMGLWIWALPLHRNATKILAFGFLKFELMIFHQEKGVSIKTTPQAKFGKIILNWKRIPLSPFSHRIYLPKTQEIDSRKFWGSWHSYTFLEGNYFIFIIPLCCAIPELGLLCFLESWYVLNRISGKHLLIIVAFCFWREAVDGGIIGWRWVSLFLFKNLAPISFLWCMFIDYILWSLTPIVWSSCLLISFVL